MNETEICPVCCGSGFYIVRDRYQYFVDNPKAKKIPEPVECHGCNSKGWIVIPKPQETK